MSIPLFLLVYWEVHQVKFIKYGIAFLLGYFGYFTYLEFKKQYKEAGEQAKRIQEDILGVWSEPMPPIIPEGFEFVMIGCTEELPALGYDTRCDHCEAWYPKSYTREVPPGEDAVLVFCLTCYPHLGAAPYGQGLTEGRDI
jgi:hypothetical protein